MSAPRPRVSPRRLFLILVACGWVLLLLIARVDGPQVAHGWQVMVAVHDSLLPRDVRFQPGSDAPPRLEGTVTTADRGDRLTTWMFRLHGRSASVHHFERPLATPPTARVLRPGEPEVATFELEDLTFLAWEDGGTTWAVAGTDGVDGLLALAERVQGAGIDALSSPRGSGPSDAGAGTSPAPR